LAAFSTASSRFPPSFPQKSCGFAAAFPAGRRLRRLQELVFAANFAFCRPALPARQPVSAAIFFAAAAAPSRMAPRKMVEIRRAAW